MRLMPVFSLPSISSLTSDLHVKPPPPGSPPTPALAQGQNEEFPRREDEAEEGISGFISTCHSHTEGGKRLEGRNGKGRGVKGHRRRSPPFIHHHHPLSPLIPDGGGRAAPRTGIAASRGCLGEVPGRRAAKLQRDHNSND